MNSIYALLTPLVRPLTWLLETLHFQLGIPWGWSIVALTVIVRVAMIPLTVKQQQSFRAMQALQPEIKKLQAKYKDDKAKMNEELLKFYQENKINPLAGCLPLIITFPIGIAVFRTFRNGIQKHIPETGTLGHLYRDMCTKSGDLLTTKQCGSYLADYPKGQTPPVFRFLGMNLDWSACIAQTELAGHAIEWVPYFLLIGIVIF